MTILTVRFTNTSIGNPDSIDLDFGDGSAHAHSLPVDHDYDLDKIGHKVSATLTVTRGTSRDTLTRVISFPTPPVSTEETLNDIVWDGYGSKFIIVGDAGTVMITVDGVLKTILPVPIGVSDYKLTGIATSAGNDAVLYYVIAGTKEVSPGNYSLLILTSTNGTNWTIDSEVAFSSGYDPAISHIKVYYNADLDEFVINGSTLQIITGHPGAWSDPTGLQYFDYMPIKSLFFKDGLYYALTKMISCSSVYLNVSSHNPDFSYAGSNLIDYSFDDSDERCPFFFDYGSSLFTASYYNSYEGKFIVTSAFDIYDTWEIDVDVVSTKQSIGVTSVAISSFFIVGGNLTDSGIIYYLAVCGDPWVEVPIPTVSLNAVAYDGSSTILAVGYQGAVEVIPLPD